MGEKAYITADIIRWARVSARMSLETASEKIRISPEKLVEWETGISFPTIKQAEKLAKLYKRPFAILFLPEIPTDFQPLRDFRRRDSVPLSTSSTFIIREIQQKQAWISDEMRVNGEAKLNFYGRFSMKNSPGEVASDIVSTLGIVPGNYSNENPLRVWIERAEAKGIFVSRTSFIHSRMKLDSDEFQGFAISDPFAPFVFLNTDDWDKPVLFTLVHELAHVWIAETGISNVSDMDLSQSSGLDPIELFCNEVAANALMPIELMRRFSTGIFNSVGTIYQGTRDLGVSTRAFLVRAYKLGMIDLQKYKTLKRESDLQFAEFLKKEEERLAARKSSPDRNGPSYYLLQLNRNGRLFTQIVLDGFKGGSIEPTQASFLLNVKINNFNGLEKQLYK